MAKVSDLVAQFLASRGIRHVFAIAGGASLHLIHSMADAPGIDYVCMQHEQGIAMAADGYARAAGRPGAAIATSGPGGTNMITGIAGAYYDSIPVIYITGQVSTHRQKRDSGVRQMGFQETDIVSICRPITKYAVTINDPRRVLYELEKGWHLATAGRPGPVLLDVADDVQREEIDPAELPHYGPLPAAGEPEEDRDEALDAAIDETIACLRKARRPVLIPGWGIRLAGAAADLGKTIDAMGIPFTPTWAALDVVPASHPCFAGTFGTHGTRYGNFTVQNADLVLAVGTRLDTHLTGSPLTAFAPQAKKIVVDIDPAELEKFSRRKGRVDLAVCADAGRFLRRLGARAPFLGLAAWRKQIATWKSRFPICPPAYYAERDANPYVFVRELARACSEDEVIFLDTGCVLAWTMQAFECRGRQRLFHDFNNTAMGYALPASIGACFALGRRRVVCMIGDGSLQMTIQELATVVRHQLPIAIVLVNNHGYSMIRQTQDQWLGSRYHASGPEGGLGLPDFVRIAEAYGFRVATIARNAEIRQTLAGVLAGEGPVFCNLEVSAAHRVIPQVKFGRPLEDAEPLLDRRVLRENMLTEAAARAA